MGRLGRQARRLGASLRAMLRQLWNEHSAPGRLGAAVGLGILIGCSPFYGLHSLIAVGLALLLRLNKIAVLLGSQISIPPLAPLIALAAVQLGSLVLSGQLTLLSAADFTGEQLPQLVKQFFTNWLVGGAILGTALGLVGFAVTTLWLGRRDRQQRALAALQQVAAEAGLPPSPLTAVSPPELLAAWGALCRQVRAQFVNAPRGHRHYLAAKLRLDPVYRQVWTLLPAVSRVVDLGTGLALLPVTLLLGGRAEEALGVEWDPAKLASARQAAEGLPGLQLLQADARQLELPSCEAILAIDLLHYFPPVEQQALLARAAAALVPGGLLLVRDTERRRGALLTRVLEALAVRWGWNKGPSLNYRSRAEWRAAIEGLGLRYGEAPSSSLMHRGNLLFWGQRER